MNAHTNTPSSASLQIQPLAFAGSAIRDRGEMLSLTDMWKAGGEDPSKKPADWARKEGSDFIEHIAVVLNMPLEHILRASRGRTGATFAHWQITLAYAKYLSPEFHVWCNTVVRERMEGKSTSGNISVATLSEEVKNTLGGIVKKVVNARMQELISTLLPSAVAGYIADHNLSIADGVTAGEVCDLAKVTTHYPRGVSGKVSRRLTAFCIRNGERPRITRMGRVRAQLFPTHIARDWLEHDEDHGDG